MCFISRLTGFAASYKDDYDYLVGNETDCSRMAHLCGSVIMIAVVVIGSMAAAGAFPSYGVGWTTIGLGGCYMGVKLLGDDWRTRRVDLISSAVIAALLITFGSLGAAGVLTGAQVGYSLLSVTGLTACMTVGMMVGAKRLFARPPRTPLLI